MRRIRRITAIASLATVALNACDRAEPNPPPEPIRADASWPNVLLISVDTLRPDHLGCYGYERKTSPRIDRLAAEGVLFENAISSTSWTLPAHAALFTGLVDSVHGCTDTDKPLDASRVTLAERLREVGYATVGFFAGPYLHPVFGLGQGFDSYIDCTSYLKLSAEAVGQRGTVEGSLPIMQASHRDVTNPRVFKAINDWLSENAKRPFFMFVHLWDVHFDFLPPPPYDTKFDPDYAGSVTGENFFLDRAINAELPQRDIEHLIALYDGEIAWTDEYIGRILDRFDELGLTDTTIVVLTSDHGTEFFEHGDKAHRKTLYDEVIRIPLIVRYPGKIEAGRRVREQARIIDAVPTLLDLLEMPLTVELMGQSLVPAMSGQRSAQDTLAVSELFSVGRELRSYRRPERKFIRNLATDRHYIFDLSADPGEQSPATDPSLPFVKAARRDGLDADAWLAEYRAALPVGTSAAELPPKVRKKLESLGYVGRKDRP